MGEAAAWAVRHRVAMQQPHVAVDGGPLVEAAPADLYAALVGMTPAKLLDNPRENSADMLAPDVNYGVANNRITNTKCTVLTGGDKYICFACAFGAIRLEEMARTRGADIAATEPVYGANDGVVSSWT